MTIAPRSRSSLQLSLPPFSHFHPSSSPPATPILPFNDISTRKFNHLFTVPHPSRAALGGEEGAQELSRDIAMDRDSVFHLSQSRVLRASLPFSSRRVRSSAVSVLQPPTVTVRFPSEPLPGYCARKQESTRSLQRTRTQSHFFASR
jgi:hypothetical protein